MRITSGALSKIWSLVLLGLLALAGVNAQAQSRINDRDMEKLMKNLSEDAKSFQNSFKSSVHKSTIRKTSRESDAKNLVDRFQKQTESMAKNFKASRKADGNLRQVMNTGDQVERLVDTLQLGPDTSSKWSRIRAELNQIAGAYGIDSHSGVAQPPMTSDATQTNDACTQSAGVEMANRLANECAQVSTATHPPCNATNSCALIIDEIKRGCGGLGTNAPAFCNTYR